MKNDKCPKCSGVMTSWKVGSVATDTIYETRHCKKCKHRQIRKLDDVSKIKKIIGVTNQKDT